MSDDLKVGDVVVCVDASPSRNPDYNHNLARGRYYRIEELDDEPDDTGVVGLWLCGEPRYWTGYASFRFRKLPRASDKFTRRIRACRPHDEQVSA